MTLATMIQAGYFAAMAIGVSVIWVYRKRLASTDKPKLLALCNSLGGAAAAAIGSAALFKSTADAAAAVSAADMASAAQDFGFIRAALAVIGTLVGAVGFSGSLILCAKLQGWMAKVYLFPGQRAINRLLFLTALALGVLIIFQLDERLISAFLLVCLVLGVSMTLPVVDAELSAAIPLYTAFTGLALAFDGFVTHNPALIIAGLAVAASGAQLAQRAAK